MEEAVYCCPGEQMAARGWSAADEVHREVNNNSTVSAIQAGGHSGTARARRSPWVQHVQDLAEQEEELVGGQGKHAREQGVLGPVQAPTHAVAAALEVSPSPPEEQCPGAEGQDQVKQHARWGRDPHGGTSAGARHRAGAGWRSSREGWRCGHGRDAMNFKHTNW